MVGYEYLPSEISQKLLQILKSDLQPKNNFYIFQNKNNVKLKSDGQFISAIQLTKQSFDLKELPNVQVVTSNRSGDGKSFYIQNAVRSPMQKVIKCLKKYLIYRTMFCF